MFQGNSSSKRFNLLNPANSMARELAIGLAILVGFMEAVMLGGIYFYTSQNLRAEFHKKVDNTESAVRENLTRLLWAMDFEDIENLGRFYVQADFLDEIYIWRDWGILIFHSGNPETGINRIERSMDLFYGEIPVGRTTFFISMKRYEQQIVNMRNAFLGTFIISIFIIMLTTGMLLRYILKKPLLEVSRWVNRIVEGDYSYRYGGPVSAELENIIRQFKSMASTLEEKEDRHIRINKELGRKVKEQLKTEKLLQDAHADLERKIGERTAQLTAANRELQLISSVDDLTQIANRRKFDRYLKLEWEKACREKSHLSLLICDVDFFKLYNDSFGHQAGDECLKRVAGVIAGSLKRPSDLAARYGGEEFSVIMPGTDGEGAFFVAERIQENLAGERIKAPDRLAREYLTLSIGVSSCVPSATSTAEALVEQADRALYRAKARGKNRVCAQPDRADTLQAQQER